MNTSDIELRYQKTLDFLYNFVDYSLTRQLRYSPEKFNLERMQRLMDLLDNPQQNYPIVHVAGTKGKGSTCAMIDSILRCAGLKVGLYTSPHLHDFVERIQINGKPLSHEELVNLVDKMRPAIEKVPEITTFEITTAIGFLAFSDVKVDIAVIEVGLGGRLDATNIITPLVSVITSLSMDHINILGNTLELIAAEKGGIIKPGIKVVLALQKPEALKVIREICEERNAPILYIPERYNSSGQTHSMSGQSFQITKTNEHHQIKHPYTIPLLGSHQVENAMTAYGVIELLQRSGVDITEHAILNGFSSVLWPGRFEVIHQHPTIIIDSAHNGDSADRLEQTISDYFGEKKVILVFGASEDKDVAVMFKHLLPRTEFLIVTRSSHPRAMEVNILVELAGKEGVNAIAAETIENAIEQALAKADQEKVIIITGSIFIAAAAREVLLKKDN